MKLIEIVFIFSIIAMYVAWQFSSDQVISKIGGFLMFTLIFIWNMFRIRKNTKIDKKKDR